MKTRFTRSARLLATAAMWFLISVSAFAEDRFEGLAAFVERGMELWHVPGMAVTVVGGEDVLFRQAFGTTSLENGQAVDEHTLFAIASTTKAMVVAGLLMLADEGRLSLDDAVVKHLPEVHFSDTALTSQLMVRDLLAHRTGLPSTDFWAFFQEMPLDEQIRRLAAVPPEAPMRTRLIYQNTMFELAGQIIERLSGQPWDHFVRDRLWRPIGMNETLSSRVQIGAQQSRVSPYFWRDGELMLADWDIPEDLAEAAGSVWSSIHDMGLWAQFLLRGGVTADGERLISEAGIAQMFEPHQLASRGDFYPTVELTRPNWRSYGLGWFQQDFQGRKIEFHTGSLSGLIAIIGLDRAGDRAVVVLGNRDHAEMRHAVLWEVMDESPAGQRRDWNQETFDLYEDMAESARDDWAKMETQRLRKTRPSLPREDYTGLYESPLLGQVRIEQMGKDLVLKTRRINLELSHWQLDTFVLEHKPWGLREFAEFRIGPDGKIAELDLFDEQLKPVSEEE